MSAPYSDNLYSGEASDDEDVLSPADGYFHASSPPGAPSGSQFIRPSANVPNVPNVLVEDPTLHRQSVNKAVEAEQERLNTGNAVDQQTSFVHPSRATHFHRRSVEEDEPLSFDVTPEVSSSQYSPNPLSTPSTWRQHSDLHLHQRRSRVDAPPAYSASHTSPLLGQAHGRRSCSTSQRHITMGALEEQRLLLPQEPESMGGPPEGSSSSRRQRLRSCCHISNARSRIRTVLGFLLIVSIILSIVFAIAGLVLAFSSEKPGLEPQPNPPVKSPGENHGVEFKWDPMNICSDAPIAFPKTSTAVAFDHQKGLRVIQRNSEAPESDIVYHGYWMPHVSGEVVLRPTHASSTGSIDLEVISNHEDLNVDVQWNEKTRIFEIITPAKQIDWNPSEGKPCIQIRATVWVPEQARLQNFGVSTVSLDIDIREGLVMGVERQYMFESVKGRMMAPYQSETDADAGIAPYSLDGREIRITTVSADIRGWYPLYDLLKMESASGHIDVDVDFEDVDLKQPRPAVLDAATLSGDVTMKLRLWLVHDPALGSARHPMPRLLTDTKSGSTRVEVIEPSWANITQAGNENPSSTLEVNPPGSSVDDEANDDDLPGSPYIIIHPNDAIDTAIEEEEFELSDIEATISEKPALGWLYSRHSSISGSINVIYPSSWEGSLLAETISGAQTIHGKDLRVIRRENGFQKRTEAEKGSGHSKLTVTSISGAEQVLIGLTH